MTTTVTVSAHCDHEKTKVVVALSASPIQRGEELTILEDGDVKDFVVYDDRKITVREVAK